MEVQQFIHACFAEAFGADVKDFLPNLFCLREETGRIDAALGYRIAGDKPLFLENYLSRPVEHYLADLAGAEVARSAIVEVGNLAALSAGGSRFLIAALTAFLKGQGAEWVVFTGTLRLLNSFARLGLEPAILAPARREWLPPGETDWGRYYEHQPLVAAGNVESGFTALKQRILLEQALATSCRALWLRCYASGLQQPARA